jgi:chaperonin GroES
MSVNVHPLGDYVVAQPEEAATKTASGIYLPSGSTEKPKVAVVLAVGPGRVGDDNERVPMTVKVGDRIVYKDGYGSVHTYEKYLLVREEDIIATLK